MAKAVIFRRGEQGQHQNRHLLTNGVSVVPGDLVYLTSGALAKVTTSSAVLGIAQETKTGTGANRLYIEEICNDAEYLITSNATITQADEGVYFRLTAAFLLDKTSGAQTTTARQVVVTKYLTATTCLVKFVKNQDFSDN